MKKLIVAFCAVAMGVMTANAEFLWSWWAGAPEENTCKNAEGCVLGIASEVKSIKGAQVSLCYSAADEVKSGCQFSLVYSEANSVRNGAQIGFVTNAEKASLQFGLICINKTGFLPVFPFFNFSKGCFGAVK